METSRETPHRFREYAAIAEKTNQVAFYLDRRFTEHGSTHCPGNGEGQSGVSPLWEPTMTSPSVPGGKAEALAKEEVGLRI